MERDVEMTELMEAVKGLFKDGIGDGRIMLIRRKTDFNLPPRLNTLHFSLACPR